MKRKYIKLNDGYSHLSLGNIINVIKEQSINKAAALQSHIFCVLFDADNISDSTINNYCIGSRSIGNDYKQKYIIIRNKFDNNKEVFLDIMLNVLTIVNGSIYNIKDISLINKNRNLEDICKRLYNIAKNDLYVSSDDMNLFSSLYRENNYYELFARLIIYAVLVKKQPLYEDEKTTNIVETFLENTKISVNDLQSYLILEMNGGSNFDYSLVNLAKSGNAYANYQLGINEYRGYYSGIPNYQKAFDYFRIAADKNHPSAYWQMGNMIKNGLIYDNDYKAAISYFNKAMELGNVAAINSLGIMYLNGIGVKKNENKALKLFEDAANKNYAYAYNNLANYFRNKDQNKMIDYFLKSALLGESYACKELGIIYLNNNDYVNAYYYFNKALDSSIKERNIWAYYYLAKYFYLCGSIQNNLVNDINKAINYFELSGELIDSLIQLLFIYYELGDLDNVYKYKKLIENSKYFNDKYKKDIDKVLKDINNKKINIPS